MLAALTPILLFVAFVLLLVVSLSVPIAKTIYLLQILVNVSSGLLKSGANASVKVGVWGYCVSSIDVTVFGSQHSSAKAQCSKPKLGYTFDQTVASALHFDGLEDAVSDTLTAALVLHPIACGLTFLALIISLAMAKRGASGASRIASLFTFGFAALAALITTIIFFVDVGLVASVRHKVKNETDGDLQLDWGNAVWMVLGAAIAIWASLLGACAGICFGHRNRKTETY